MQPVVHEPIVLRPASVLGEAPLWNGDRHELNWIDCDRKTMFRFDPAIGEARALDLAGHPGSYAFCTDGRVLMAYRTGLLFLDPGTGAQETVESPIVDFATTRFNDGTCDRAGRFWLGTMHKTMSEPLGALYRIDPDRSIRRMADGFTVSNGIAFSPDDTVMYHVDSRPGVIYAYDYDLLNGEIDDRRVFARFDTRHERPDGCTIDRDGCLWVAMLGGARVAVFDPDGREMQSLPLPTRRPTSLCFGGQNLDTLFVTSMRFGLSPEELAAQPDAGCVFSFQGAGTGLPEPKFG